MKMLKKLRDNFWLHVGGMMLVMILLVFALAYSCERQVEKHQKETGKTILQSLGEEFGKAKREFEKGYTNDTIK